MAFLSAVLWGLWWIPIRLLEGMGLDGAWGTVAMNAGAALTAAVWMAARRARLKTEPLALLGAALVGVAVSTYSVAITMADVVRVILLFYLAPAWAKVIEWAFMGRGWRWASTLTVSASLAGAYLVLGAELSLAAIGPGDVLAVFSGMCWSAGAALIFREARSSPLSLSLVSALCATAVGLGFVLPGGGTVPAGGIFWAGAGAGAGAGFLYVLPILVLTLWSAQRLSPAVISFLLTAEILSGVISGALLLDEPFGLLRAAGAALILLAAMSEVLPSLRPPRPSTW